VVVSLRRVAPLFIAAFLVLPLTACGGGDDQTDTSVARQGAIDSAMRVYTHKKVNGADFSSGPCISESLSGFNDWVADVAHDPRLPIDDQPANQCRRYRDGEAHHFVELTPDGRLIRAE
jgi:hypothetical protein